MSLIWLMEVKRKVSFVLESNIFQSQQYKVSFWGIIKYKHKLQKVAENILKHFLFWPCKTFYWWPSTYMQQHGLHSNRKNNSFGPSVTVQNGVDWMNILVMVNFVHFERQNDVNIQKGMAPGILILLLLNVQHEAKLWLFYLIDRLKSLCICTQIEWLFLPNCTLSETLHSRLVAAIWSTYQRSNILPSTSGSASCICISLQELWSHSATVPYLRLAPAKHYSSCCSSQESKEVLQRHFQ